MATKCWTIHVRRLSFPMILYRFRLSSLFHVVYLQCMQRCVLLDPFEISILNAVDLCMSVELLVCVHVCVTHLHTDCYEGIVL